MASRRCFWLVGSGGGAGKVWGEPVRASIRQPSTTYHPLHSSCHSPLIPASVGSTRGRTVHFQIGEESSTHIPDLFRMMLRFRPYFS